ncbi:COG1470 family protein, partial [Poseidonia sp.]|uniref:COG1470 family protein n=1 Tax=Poseidonia sp. TaxID=2666344 RepID=UPI003F697DFB
VNTTLPVQFQVLPDREPLIIQPEKRPSCPPGYTCPFEVEIQNIGDATDVFDLGINQLALPSGWGVQFSWAQATSILVRPDQPVLVGLSMTVPLGATPDTVVSFSLQATSQNNTEKFHSLDIDIAASMISEAYVGMTTSQASNDWHIDAGEAKIVTFTIWNNASRQDIFSMTVEYEPKGMWIIEQPSRPD